jgi:GST-like protein
MEKRLSHSAYLAGNDYTIADIAAYPWTLAATNYLNDALAGGMKNKPAVQRWLDVVGARPAVQRGMAVPKI